MPKGTAAKQVGKPAKKDDSSDRKPKVKPKTSIGKKKMDSRKKREFKSRSIVRHMKKNREKDA